MDNATNRALNELAKLDKAKGGTGTDYSIAKQLGVPPNIISNYRRGVSQMDHIRALRLAELLGVQPMRLIADIESERARDGRAKKFWQATVKAHGGKVAAVILSASLGSATFTPASDLGRGNAPSLLEKGAAELCILCKAAPGKRGRRFRRKTRPGPRPALIPGRIRELSQLAA